MKLQLPNVPKYFTTQAQVAILGYLILSIAILLPVNMNGEEYNFLERVLSLLMMALPMIVTVYTINCLVLGTNKGGLPCGLLAWLNSGAILLWSVLILILTLMLYATNGNPQAVTQVTSVEVVEVVERPEAPKVVEVAEAPKVVEVAEAPKVVEALKNGIEIVDVPKVVVDMNGISGNDNAELYTVYNKKM
jgi:hypothetical protein